MTFTAILLAPMGSLEILGAAVLASRQKLKEDGENDWANYILYGNADFVLKQAPGLG